MDRLILNLIGNPGSGKTTVAEHLIEKYGFYLIRPSDLISQYAERQQIPLNGRADYIAVYALMRRRLGDDIFSKTILNTDSDLVCVDGLRVPTDVARLKKDGAKVIALWCPLKQRFERRAAELPTGAISFQQFKNEQMLDYHGRDPTAPSTITVMAEANYHIDASTPLPRVLKDIDVIVEKS